MNIERTARCLDSTASAVKRESLSSLTFPIDDNMKCQQDRPHTADTFTRAARRYVCFLHTAQASDSAANLPALDPIEERLLQVIILKHSAGERLCVRDLIHKETLGSSTMLHRRLTVMRKKGWLQLDDTEDTRRKRVALTEAAMQHLDWLGSCILDAAQ